MRLTAFRLSGSRNAKAYDKGVLTSMGMEGGKWPDGPSEGLDVQPGMAPAVGALRDRVSRKRKSSEGTAAAQGVKEAS